MKKQIIPIEKADKETIATLIALGIIYVGSDNKLHVKEGN
jgi:hypothetical protein